MTIVVISLTITGHSHSTMYARNLIQTSPLIYDLSILSTIWHETQLVSLDYSQLQW